MTQKKLGLATRKQRYVCYSCGTEVVVDSCGAGFSELVCCNRIMEEKRLGR